MGLVAKRRTSTGWFLVYLTHVTGLFAICSTIHWLLPGLTKELWAGILLAMMVAELSYRMGRGIWRRSAWVFGLVLAGTSLLFLWHNWDVSWSTITSSLSNWGIMWLITPAMFTVVAIRSQRFHRNLNSGLSVASLMVAQLLTLPVTNIRLIGLLTGMVLMIVNTAYFQNSLYPIIVVGFGLASFGKGLWEFFPDLSLQIGLVIGACTTLSLWLCHKLLNRQGSKLAKIYGFACDKWAIALCIAEL